VDRPPDFPVALGGVFWQRTWPKLKQAFIDPAIAEMLGYAAEELHRRPDPFSWVCDEDLEPARAQLERGLATGQPFFICCRLKHCTGRPVPVLVRVYPGRDATGNVTHLNGVLFDLSDTVVPDPGYQTFRTAYATTSHDVENALAGILTQLALLQGVLPPEYLQHPALPSIEYLVQRDSGHLRQLHHALDGRLEAAPPTGQSNPMTNGPAAGQACGRVLIVDDDRVIRESLELLLEHRGYQVLSAADGASAIELFAETCEQLSLVILDVVLPDADGYDIMHQMRRMAPDIKLIIMSGEEPRDGTDWCQLSRHTRFLQKPFTMERLYQELGSLLQPAR
jgi:CheY-like chemotaxis protein